MNRRLSRIVAERRPDLGDEVRQVGFHHERARPEPLLQLGLGHGSRPRGDEEFQQVESLA
jgi:hypothetical protein